MTPSATVWFTDMFKNFGTTIELYGTEDEDLSFFGLWSLETDNVFIINEYKSMDLIP